MLDFSKRIVKLRYVIIIIAVLLLIPSAIGFFNTRINYDILYYLPDDIETMKGQDILLEDFGKGAYGIYICKDKSTKELIDLEEKISAVEHVSKVISFDSATGGKLPKELLPEKIKNILYSKNGDGSLMFIFFDSTSSSDETMAAVNSIRELSGKNCFLSSMASIATDTKDLVESEMVSYTVIAVLLTLIVLTLTTDSFMIPILFLASIGMAVVYNLGSNFIQGEISYITMALVAILQLGVTMDYSIFLYHSFTEQKATYEDDKEAMAHAIAATISSVTGSSLTTIAGFLAMCFMTFTLGLDMGVVMAKGVVIGVICCVTVLPSLILVFRRAISKTRHKALVIPTKKITKFVVKNHIIIAIVLLLLWIPALIGYKNLDIYYKLDNSLPADIPSRQANTELEAGYDISSVSMALIDTKLPAKEVKRMLSEIGSEDGIAFALGSDSLIGSLIPAEIIPKEVTKELQSDRYKLILISSEYEVATDEINAQCDRIAKIIKKYDSNGMLIGEAPATKDLVDITNRDFSVVSIISIGAIFLLILFVLKSVSLPVILVLVIELAIYINMGISFFAGSSLPFIASICVGTIQLGATVDYAILLTNRYKTERIAGLSKKEAVGTALSTSINAIFSSALGFFSATIGVALFSDIDLIGSICMLLARGAILSMVIVILLLPSMLMLLDGLVVRSTIDMKDLRRKAL